MNNDTIDNYLSVIENKQLLESILKENKFATYTNPKDFVCPCCETRGEWLCVDEFRLNKDRSIDNGKETKDPLYRSMTVPMGTSLCKICGMVTYTNKHQDDETIKEYYRSKYRSIPQVGNLFSGERKLHYHQFFLKPLFDEWRKHGIDKPVVGEIGSALGMFLNWLKTQIPGAEIHGTELTQGFRKAAYYEYGINLTEDFDYTKKYDLITSYHVLEHQLFPDLKLEKYAECLKDSGVFYLSCPIWFRDLNNSATGGFDIEYYLHPDHINAWSEEHLEWIIARAGLDIVHKNTDVYGNTYILKKGIKKLDMPKWNVIKNKEFIENAYKVWMALQENKPEYALSLHNNCVAAMVHHYELNRSNFHKDRVGLDKFLSFAEESCSNSGDALVFVADVLSRYDRYDEAIVKFHLALNKKPNAPSIIMGLSNCYRQKALREKDEGLKIEYVKKSLDALQFVADTSMELKDKAISWKFHDLSLLPLPN